VANDSRGYNVVTLIQQKELSDFEEAKPTMKKLLFNANLHATLPKVNRVQAQGKSQLSVE
jgi:hypothetical protein